MLKIVVVEDHDSLRIVTMSVLQQHGYEVTGLSCAEELDNTAIRSAEIFIVDLNLPDEDGISLTKRIRQANPNAGVVMVTARNSLDDKVLGYESGADIYLAKPVAPVELLATVSALMRRMENVKEDKSNDVDLVLDMNRLLLESKFEQININPDEARILNGLIMAKNHSLDHSQLVEIIGKSEELDKAHLEVKIHRLRRKLMQMGKGKNAIKSLRQQGYQLCVNITSC